MEVGVKSANKILIIGGSGFIGRHVVKEALKKGLKTTVLSKAKRLDVDMGEAELLVADISCKDSVSVVLKNRDFDYVINLGGYISHKNYSDGGQEIYNVHFEGVRNLVDCLDREKIKCFVQIGSSDEYGGGVAPQKESQREQPISPYSCAKVASTHFLQTLYRTEGFPVVILRPFLVYGPDQGQDRFIPQIIKGCLNNRRFPTSEGGQLRDFCFIDDFVRAVFLAISRDNAHGEVINIASGKPVAIKDIVNRIVSIVGSGCPQFGQIAYRDGENMSLYGDISKAKEVLDWQPNVDLESGLFQTIERMKGACE